MPIRTAIWKVGGKPQRLPESSLQSEEMLERMIVEDSGLLGEEWMIIGRQEDTGLGGRVDLLAIAPEGSIALIELKRDRTPRDVVAQALEYASWVAKLRAEDVAAIYRRFKPGHNFADDFRQRFGHDLDEETLNQSHEIIIVAASLDARTERIVAYLGERGVAINALCFQVFTNGDEQLMSRTWLLDPVRTQVSTASSTAGATEPWNGEFYCSFGHGESRSWEDARQYGFISGGGGAWYSRTLQLLNPGDRVWVRVPGQGYVGVGRATGRVQPASEFRVRGLESERPVLEVAKGGHYHREFASDPERCEYFVPMRWLDTVSLEKAIEEVGFFGNQNTVCRPTTPRWRATVERLKQILTKFDE